MVRIDSMILFVILSLGLGANAWPQGPLVFERLVDSSTPIPNGGSDFFLDNHTPAPCDLGVVFAGADPSLTETGIYWASRAEISVIADENALAPGGGALDDLEHPACSGRRAAFLGVVLPGVLRGAFAWSAGELETLVLEGTPAPQGGSVISSVSQVVLSANRASFKARLSPLDLDVLYLIEGTSPVLVPVVDTTTPVPGVPEVFHDFSGPALSDDLVAFRGLYGVDCDGIYSWSSGQLDVIADEQTPVPERPGAQFSFFGAPSVWDDRVVFTAVHSQGQGLYSASAEGLAELFAPGDPAPGGGVFVAFERPAAGPRGVAFFALTSTGDRALFLQWDGLLQRVLGTLDTLDGERVLTINYALGESALAFRVLFEDSSQAIYQARLGVQPIPALSPRSLGLLVFLLALAGVWSLSRRRKISGRGHTMRQR